LLLADGTRIFVADQREAHMAALPKNSQPPDRPASIRTLEELFRSGAVCCSQSLNGCCHLSIELDFLPGIRSAATSQSPEPGDLL
jgi:hypothetical protein